MSTLLRALVTLGAVALTTCGTPVTDAPADLDFAQRLVARTEPAEPSEERSADRPEVSGTPVAVTVTALPPKTRADEWRGLLDVSGEGLAALESAAADDRALGALLRTALGVGDLATLAVLRSPQVRTARARYEAARTAYGQSNDLEDLVGLYRSFTRDTATRVGPQKSRRATGMFSPTPNVGTLSAEVANRTAEMAFESLRASIREVLVRAWRAHADAARLHRARQILREDVELDSALLEVLLSRLESGTGSQAGYLAFQSRLERLRTELEILDRRETVVRAEWNRLLSRPEAEAVVLTISPEFPGEAVTVDDEPAVVELAGTERQELRSARLAAERATLAVRMAETMTLPRLDVGSSRFERERAGEAGIQRGPVFPRPGRMIMPRSDFGVREAQVQEMRSKAASLGDARDSLRDQVRTDTRRALFDVDAAVRRLAVHEREVVPLASRSLDAARGAYEGNRGGYLDLLDAVRRLLDARLGLADARRDLTYAQATLLHAVGVETTHRR